MLEFSLLEKELNEKNSPSATRALDVVRCLYETHKGFFMYKENKKDTYAFRLCLTEAGKDHFAVFRLQANSFSLNIFMPEIEIKNVKNNSILVEDKSNKNWRRVSGENIKNLEAYAIIGLILWSSKIRKTC